MTFETEGYLYFHRTGRYVMNGDELIERHREGGSFAEVDGLKIFYRCAGPENGIPLVLTHGIPRSSFLYRMMIPILAQHYPVRAWDLYGFGLSDKPKDICIDTCDCPVLLGCSLHYKFTRPFPTCHKESIKYCLESLSWLTILKPVSSANKAISDSRNL